MNIKELLDAYTIEIPALQRNYVHGEDTARAKEVREHFLTEFCGVVRAPQKKFDLNFVYGTKTKEDKKFIPVDGQQRLTTLWLLATFLVHRNPGGTANDRKAEWIKRLSKFTYVGRPLAEVTAKSLAMGATRTQLIASGLCRDATCAALVGTLETIENHEQEFGEDFCALENALERVVFEFQDIPQGAEETYIKMNARGKALTQWENFKGKFSELLVDKEKESWDKQIEKLTDDFIKCHDEKDDLEKVLPDAPFFVFMGRVLLYEKEKLLLKNVTNGEKKEKEELQKGFEKFVPNLVALSSYSFDNKDARNLPYVPFEEFKMAMGVDSEHSNLKLDIGEVSKNILKFICWIINIRSNPGLVYPYWQNKGRTLWEVSLRPQNERERDLGLVLYEYSNRFVNIGKTGMDNLALRLVTNIVENDEGDRIGHCLRFFCNGEALYGTAAEGNIEAWQMAEEIQKGRIYSLRNQEVTQAMQRLECELKGRVRIAILDLSKKPHESMMNDLQDNIPTMLRRMRCLEALLKHWKEQNDDNLRSSIFFYEIIPRFEWDGPSEIDFNFKIDGLSDLLRSPNDKCLQRTLVDCKSSAAYLSSKYSGYGAGKFGRDWRKIIQARDMREVFQKGIKIRWHNGTGRYYLYTGSQVRWAYPISDYRIDLLWNNDLCEAFWGECPTELDGRMEKGQINDAGTISRKLNNGLHVYLYADRVVIKAYGIDGQNGREEEKLVESDDISWMPKYLIELRELRFEEFINKGLPAKQGDAQSASLSSAG